MLGGQFVLAIKNVGTKEETHKTIFIAQGHTDAQKNMIFHNSSNVKRQRRRFITALATIYGLKIWTQDVLQAIL